MARVNALWISGFTADTPVLMTDGKVKPISKIKEGEWVMSFDPKTRERIPGRVIDTYASVMSDILEVTVEGKSMLVAEQQRFYTPAGEFKIASDAEAILARDGKVKQFTTKKHAGKVKIYDITVQDSHSFFADGLMVHNGGGGGGGSKPAPPPDPVVTAGKIGKPLTVVTNGNVVTVPAQPGSVASVSVSHSGGVSTGYSSVPGVPVTPLIPLLPPPRFPYDPLPGPYAAISAAKSNRDLVCGEMSATTGAVSDSTKSQWQTYLRNIRSNVAKARSADKVSDNRYTRQQLYSDINIDVADLEKFLKKNKNFTSKDLTFINGKCSELETSLNSLQSSMTGSGGVYKPIGEEGKGRLFDGRTWSDQPEYQYYKVDTIDSSGRQIYYYDPPVFDYAAPPDFIRNDRPKYYKHFDTGIGLFYYDKTADGAFAGAD